MIFYHDNEKYKFEWKGKSESLRLAQKRSTGTLRPCKDESVNFDDHESLNWFHRTLRKMGVIDSLREKGAGEGSTVRIAGMEFDFIE